MTSMRSASCEPVRTSRWPPWTFAHGLQVHGRFVPTTCHASKGRQFDVVILPGLQKATLPVRSVAERHLSDCPDLARRRPTIVLRRLTRARHEVHLVYSPQFTNRWGHNVDGRSTFVDEVAAHVEATGGEHGHSGQSCIDRCRHVTRVAKLEHTRRQNRVCRPSTVMCANAVPIFSGSQHEQISCQGPSQPDPVATVDSRLDQRRGLTSGVHPIPDQVPFGYREPDAPSRRSPLDE